MRETLDGDLASDSRIIMIASKQRRAYAFALDLLFYFFFSTLTYWLMMVTLHQFLSAEALIFIDSHLPGLIYLLLYFLYYVISESLLSGRSLGKLITKTRAVRLDGSKISFTQVLKRSLCRLIPLELLSYFGDERPIGLHDRYSQTLVIEVGSVLNEDLL
ncbi:RDD family protein [Lewinella sp. 4G2]|uniref:RDD family protein n=1 Tax=Lewinella sp. 4G2 TaxID=1803372 RepID=UPI0007B4AC96|nr:RDD family protein [Lewinella sp. 4G2]OAV44814.1 hypothetical protein A3850_010075 [Lewinella sp. 4G2]